MFERGFSWFKSLSGSSRKRDQKRQVRGLGSQTGLFQLETLEDRTVPFATAITNVLNFPNVTAESQELPRLAAFGDGGYISAWVNRSGTDFIRARRFSPTHSPLESGTNYIAIATTSEATSTVFDISANYNGSFVAVYVNSSHVFFKLFNPNGTVKASGQVSNNDISTSRFQPRVSMADDGGFVVVFTTTTDSDNSVMYRRYRANGTSTDTSARFVRGAESLTAGEDSPDVACAPDGTAAIVWEEHGALDTVRLSIVDTNDSYNAENLAVGNFTATDQNRPSVAVSRSGTVTVAWDYGPGSGATTNYNIQFQQTTINGATIGVTGELNPTTYGFTDRNEQYAEVAAGDGRNFTIAFNQNVNSTSTNNPFVYEYQDGAFLNKVYQINFDSDVRISYPVVARSGNNYIVAWQDYDSGTATYDAKGKAYQGANGNGSLGGKVVGRLTQYASVYISSNTSVGVGPRFDTGFVTNLSLGVNWVDYRVGDFTGEGRDDVVVRLKETGQWYVISGDRQNGTPLVWGAWSTGATWVDVLVGDVNGDGKSDLIGRYKEGGQWWVGISNGNSFATQYFTSWSAGVTWADVMVGDYTGDGKADIVGRYQEAGQWWLGRSTGTSFATTMWSAWSVGVTWTDVMTGDFNGDGKKDIIGRYKEVGQWYVGLSNGTSFATSLWGFWSSLATWSDVKVGDFNKDGKDDIIGRYKEGGDWYVSRSTGSSLVAEYWATWSAIDWLDVRVGDFNGDGRQDIMGRDNTGTWWVGLNSGKNFRTYAWGAWSPVAWEGVLVGNF